MLMKEKEPVRFNANVFKKVKLAMSEEEIKQEEAKVQDLAKFIKEQAIPKLVMNFQKAEGTPTDSKSLSEFFHQNGINIRYLGKIADFVKDQNLNHIKFMLEREVVIRAMKHIVNKYLRECRSDEMTAALLSHLFNCLLAPKEFIKKMDEGQVKMHKTTLKETAELNLLQNIKKLEGPTAAAE